MMRIQNQEVKTRKVTIDAAEAQNMLMRNISNRPLSERVVKFLVAQMKKGEWKLTTDSIGFDSNGNLINGQHRLHAVIKYGKPLEFFVAEGLDPKAFDVIDTGKVRSAGDVLGAKGITSAHHKSAIIKFVLGYRGGLSLSGKESGKRELGISNSDVHVFAEKNKEKLKDAYDMSVRVYKEFKGLKGRQIGGMYWVLSDIDRDHAITFFHYLSSGIGLKAKDPIYILRQRLIQEMGAKKKFPERDKIAWITICWNHSRKGKELTKIVWPGGDLPRPI